MIPSRLDRYVLREILGPFILGFLVYTFIMLMDVLFDAAETIIRRGVPASIVGKLLLLNMPHIVVLTIPMAFLFGILIAVGRLSADSELVAMRSSGLSLFYLYRPILVLSAFLAALNCLLMVHVLPQGNHLRERLSHQILAQSMTQQVAPRVFHEELEERVLYVFEQPPNDPRWHGVFLAQAIPKTQNRITVAETGEVHVDESSGQIVLSLRNAVDHDLDLNDPGDLQISHHDELDLRFEDRFLSRSNEVSSSKGIRELEWQELQEWSRDPTRSERDRRLAQVEIHKKFAIPAACLVFGLFGVPLGFNNRRGGGKSSGFAISIGIIMFNYVLLSNGEEAAAVGRVSPWLAMWAPNLLLTALGTFLLARRNRDKSLLLTRLDRWIRERLWGRLLDFQRVRELRRVRRRRRRMRLEATEGSRPAGGPLSPGSPPEPFPPAVSAGPSASGAPRGPSRAVLVRLPRLRLRFPSLFDRYIGSLFARVFVIVVMAGTSLYIIADITEIADEILKNDVPTRVVLDYYQYLSLQIVYQIAPIVVLLTTLVTLALLSRSNEVTAAKALGMSLYRLAVPVMVAALLVAGLSVLLESSVLPASNARVAQLKDRIQGQDRVRTYRRADRQWLYGKGGYIYNYMHYDPEREILQRLHIFRFDEEYRLTGRLYAARAEREANRWIVSGGWARTFEGAEVTSYTPLPGPQPIDLPESPEFFDTELKRPEQMNYAELESYIRELKLGGQAVPELEVELHNKLAMPVVCLVMALVGLPFAFRLGKGGALYGIGLSLVLGMIFYAIIAFFTTLGAAGALPPSIAAWSPNVLFATFSVYLFLGVRT